MQNVNLQCTQFIHVLKYFHIASLWHNCSVNIEQYNTLNLTSFATVSSVI